MTRGWWKTWRLLGSHPNPQAPGCTDRNSGFLARWYASFTYTRGDQHSDDFRLPPRVVNAPTFSVRPLVSIHAAAAICILALATPVWATDWVPVVKRIEPPIVRLEATAPEGQSICSGVVIYEHIVVTVAHCIPNDPETRSFAVNRKDAELLRLNRTLELAVLRVDKLKAPAIIFSSREVVAGLPVAVGGFGMGTHSVKYQFGFVSDADDLVVEFGTWLDALAVAGDSGGAVVDEDGALVTLLRAGWLGGHTLGVEPGVLREFVEPYKPVTTK